jgi:acyl carrier protein
MKKDYNEISSWLAARIAHYSEVAPETVRTDAEIASFRLDSLIMVNITSELEKWVGMEINPALLWEMRTIDATSQWIVENQED